MARTLKEETIRGLRNDKAFNMAEFGDACEIARKNRRRKNYCGTASCVAGHILAAGARLGRKVPKELLTDFDYGAKAILYEKGGQLMGELGLDDTGDATARAARFLWACAYGKESANKLDFYGEDFAPHTDLDDITAPQAIAHLKSL